jgi:hypothetical protein
VVRRLYVATTDVRASSTSRLILLKLAAPP